MFVGVGEDEDHVHDDVDDDPALLDELELGHEDDGHDEQHHVRVARLTGADVEHEHEADEVEATHDLDDHDLDERQASAVERLFDLEVELFVALLDEQLVGELEHAVEEEDALEKRDLDDQLFEDSRGGSAGRRCSVDRAEPGLAVEDRAVFALGDVDGEVREVEDHEVQDERHADEELRVEDEGLELGDAQEEDADERQEAEERGVLVLEVEEEGDICEERGVDDVGDGEDVLDGLEDEAVELADQPLRELRLHLAALAVLGVELDLLDERLDVHVRNRLDVVDRQVVFLVEHALDVQAEDREGLLEEVVDVVALFYLLLQLELRLFESRFGRQLEPFHRLVSEDRAAERAELEVV